MSKPAPPKNFEAALAELESMVQRMEQGELSLDAMLETYRRGHELLQFCRGRLEAVEQQARLFDSSISSANHGQDRPNVTPATPAGEVGDTV